MGAEGDGIVPTSGFSLGGEFERRLRAFQTGIELGLAVDFFYDRFTKDVIATTVGPMGDPEPADRVAHALADDLRPHGDDRVAIRRHAPVRRCRRGPDRRLLRQPGRRRRAATTDLQPLARGVFGFDFAIAPRTAAILRVDYTHTFYRDSYFVGPTGDLHPMFGDLFDAGIGFLLRF